ncbi:methylated-DNA--[protein]-cysteine S-methyltransferase [Metabacillus iocasae]|uniref:Methylated-DNA--protein-cysteine methyltransferase n=1 Tax=Priestia iocasae TaxID=2291674 RepID=A0ABS2QTL7_9BACI|nr:methylated-DNA--[protein]-cysteine S-methyltransferase [Metabacillus iocasae]MBM7702782.1 methylated-DNA-[protein]-cysteine S-methyltransferase [Metabacillus iocasae]
MTTIQWGILKTEKLTFHLAKTEKGLCYVGSPVQERDEFIASVAKKFKDATFEENEQALQPYVKELQEYIEGTRSVFSLPVDVTGTAFQQEVWEALKQIPYGKTCSYSDIAKRIGRPSAVRAVGTAIGANPVMITIPCHRVIGKNGAITGYRGGIAMKQLLLEREGIQHVKS